MYRKAPLPFIEDRIRALRRVFQKILSPIIYYLGFDYEKVRRKYIIKILDQALNKSLICLAKLSLLFSFQ